MEELVRGLDVTGAGWSEGDTATQAAGTKLLLTAGNETDIGPVLGPYCDSRAACVRAT